VSVPHLGRFLEGFVAFLVFTYACGEILSCPFDRRIRSLFPEVL
jgi:hypothetical protein